MLSYADAYSKYDKARDRLNDSIMDGDSQSQVMANRGRYIASLQVLLKSARNEGYDPNPIQDELNDQLRTHARVIKSANDLNKRGNYKIVKEMSLGVKSLINSIKLAKNARTDDEKKDTNKEVLKNVGLNLKNIVKAPIALTAKILSSPIVATVLFAPISLGLGILHAAWTCLDSKPSPYDNSSVSKMSQGFNNVMQKLNTKVQRI